MRRFIDCCQAFFFSSRGRHTRWTGDWSSDVCSSDLPGPAGNTVSLVGTSTFGDFNVVIPVAWPGCGNRTRPRTATIGSTSRSIAGFSSGRDHMGRFDGIEQVAGRIPDPEIGLRLVLGVGATNHQGTRAARRQRKLRLPLPKAVCPLVGTKLGRLPALAAIDRQIDAGNAAIAAEGDAPH